MIINNRIIKADITEIMPPKKGDKGKKATSPSDKNSAADRSVLSEKAGPLSKEEKQAKAADEKKRKKEAEAAKREAARLADLERKRKLEEERREAAWQL